MSEEGRDVQNGSTGVGQAINRRSRARFRMTAVPVIAVVALIIAVVALVISVRNGRSDDRLAEVHTDPVTGLAPTPGPRQPVQARSTSPAPTPWIKASPVKSALADVEIDRALNLKLLRDAQFERYPIDASANDRWVMLRGQVPSQELKSRAEKFARSIDGVRGVTNRITVGSE
ncbi:MAG TPA: BON domain-containing protein [Blastocatellia bacterium]|nr:BON domain-containing protein [Blastocatellia bacterium]